MGLGKTYSTQYLLDSNNSSGVAGQVLSTTSTGIDWADANTLPGAGLWLANGNDIYNSNSANVGIGTTSPQALLSLGNAVDAQKLLLYDDNNFFKYGFGIQSNELRQFFPDSAASRMVFGTISDSNGSTFSEKMRINSSGDVLIGNTIVNPASGFSNQKGFGYDTSTGNLEVASTSGTPMTIGRNESTAGEILVLRKESTVTHSFGSTDSYFLGNVGIGTTSPGAKLEVNAIDDTFNDINVLKLKRTWATATASDRAHGILFSDPNSRMATIYADRTNSGSNYNSDLLFATNTGTSGTSLSTKMVIKAGGNVGIGTASPGQKLHLNTSATLTPTYQKFTNGTATTGTTLGIDADGDFIINNGEAKEIKLYTNDSQRVTIQSGGNVGIGTTSPSEKLQVNGSTQLGRNGNNTAGDPHKTIISGQGIEDVSTGNFYGSYGFLELNANSNYTGSARRYAITNGFLANKFAIIRSDSNMGTMQLGVGGAIPTGAVADLVIDNLGQVGIGTTSPGNKLEVNGVGSFTGGAVAGVIDSHNAGIYLNTAGRGLSGNFQGYARNLINALAGGVIEIGQGTSLISQIKLNAGSSSVNGVINLMTQGSVRIKVASNGNVGIGNTSPGSLLMVGDAGNAPNGEATISLTGANTVPQILTKPGMYHRHSIGLGLYSDFKMTFEVNGVSGTLLESINLDTAGNVKFSQYGAGTLVTDASGNITVSSGGGAGGPYLPLSAGSGSPLTGALHFGDAFNYIEKNASSDMLMVANRHITFSDVISGVVNERMRIEEGGNVGIGTTTPQRLLQLRSTNEATGIFLERNSNYGFVQYNQQVGSVETYHLGFVNNNTFSSDILVANESGNVGIGTTSPDKTLTVGGTNTTHGIDIKTKVGTTVYKLWEAEQYFSDEGYQGIYYDNVKKIQFRANGDSYFVGGNVSVGDTTAERKFNVIDATDAWIRINATNYTSDWLIGTAGSSNKFKIYSQSAGLTRLAIDSIGRVGIGTEDPVYALDVVSTGDGLLSLKGGTKPVMRFMVGTSTVGTIQAQANTSLNVSAYGTSSLNLQTAGTTPRLTILTGGNVGIGTITPAAELHIMSGSASYPVDANNHLVVESSSHSYIGLGGGVGSDVGIHFGDSGASGVGRIVYKNSNDSMCFRTAGGGDHLVINSSGNVGIGVTNPGSNRLQVASTASGPVAKFDNTSNTGGSGLEVNGGNGTAFALSVGQYNGLERFRVQGNGNVGIGTTNPATQLEIFKINDDPATLRLSSEITEADLVGAIISFSNDAGGGGVQGRIENVSTEDDTTVFKFYTDNTSSPSMTLFDSGNMTIAGTLTQNSDVRLKENIKPIESALDKVKQMQGVEFNKINSSTKEIGVVAQEIEKIIPELVLEDKEGIKSVAYGNITAVLIEAIKEQQKQIEELKQQLNK